ncbi:MAG: septum formation initiator family protein [Candidatus Methylomirabilales bacterium]
MAAWRMGPPAGRKERRSIPRQLRLAALVLLVLALVSILGNRGLIRLYQMQQEKAALTREIEALGAANAVLADEVRALRGDPSRIEAIAREDLGLVKPGELVFEFPTHPATPPR